MLVDDLKAINDLVVDSIEEIDIHVTAGELKLFNKSNNLLVTTNEVIAEGNAQVARVTTEGTAQVARVEDTGTTEMAKLQTLLDNTEDTGGNATALGGKTRAQFDEEIQNGYYETITDITQDIELKEGYYEIVDNENNQYSVRVDSDLFISEGNVIENIAGYVRLKGVKMPCKLVIRQFPTLTNNTKYSFLELNSNFPSSEAVKSLIKEVI